MNAAGRRIPTARSVQAVYYTLILGNTLAASFIWGINTLFLLDAGLTNFEAFAANAFFTAGMLIFEIPTGVVADTLGRRASYLLGTATLAVTTVMYWLLWLWQSPFWAWAVVSVLLGLGFTFFSGAVDAWLVDALRATEYRGSLETVFGRAQIVGSVAMFVGSVLGGVVAQLTNLGVPFLIRAGMLVVMFVVAAFDHARPRIHPRARRGPHQGDRQRAAGVDQLRPRQPARALAHARDPVHRGRRHLRVLCAAALPARALGRRGRVLDRGTRRGDPVGRLHRGRHHRTTRPPAIPQAHVGDPARHDLARLILIALAFTTNFWIAIVLLAGWGIASSIDDPVHRAYLNDMIPSKQRATVLSFDSLLGSAGGVVFQPILGRSADLGGYGASMLWSGVISAVAVPFVLLSRAQRPPADTAREVTSARQGTVTDDAAPPARTAATRPLMRAARPGYEH